MTTSAPTLPADLDELLPAIARAARPRAADGEPAPADTRGGVDVDAFGLAVVGMDGAEHVTGEVDVPFPIQSISKVFALALAMHQADRTGGVDTELWERVGREPSGDPFNSLVQLQHERGIPRNPMINAGALVVDDVLLDHLDDPEAAILDLLCDLAGEPLSIDDDVARVEGDRGHRNLSMAYLMSSFDNLVHDPHDVLEVYARQCSVLMTARQLARAIRFLGNGGVDPASGRRVLDPGSSRRIGAMMLTCGTYDNAGEFAFSVGFPCKSGIAGAITGIVPAELGVCAWSPPLDDTGNSLAGRVALHELSERLGLSLFSMHGQR